MFCNQRNVASILCVCCGVFSSLYYSCTRIPPYLFTIVYLYFLAHLFSRTSVRYAHRLVEHTTWGSSLCSEINVKEDVAPVFKRSWLVCTISS